MVTIPFDYKTEPWEHQRECLKKCWDQPYFGIFFEQRCGKTKVVLDNAACLYQYGRIRGLLIFASNGVHTNWVMEEIPRHLPLTEKEHRCLIWRAGRAGTDSFRREFEELLAFPGLAIFAVNSDGIVQSKHAKKFIEKFIQRHEPVSPGGRRKLMVVVDESGDFATPGSKRTSYIVSLGRQVAYRRICDGTPVAEKPFDVYAPFAFLEAQPLPIGHRGKPPLRALGFGSLAAFKSNYAEWRQSYGPSGPYPELVRYRNLDDLNKRMFRHAMRVTRSQVFDIPPKIYSKRFFDLSEVQRRAYDTMREEFIIELSDGRLVAKTHVLARMTALQQIACGYLPGDEDDEQLTDLFPEPTDNPRMQALIDEIGKSPDAKVIVWARFKRDQRLVDGVLRMVTNRPVFRLSAEQGDQERTEIKRGWREIDAPAILVTSVRIAGKGVDLSQAGLVIYYSNDYSLRLRLQSEDRTEAATRMASTSVVDLIGVDTNDLRVVGCLRDKKEIADEVSGDDPREWL